MIKKPIEKTRESECKVLIQLLNDYGIYETSKGEQLQSLDYISLLSLLAIKRAVES